MVHTRFPVITRLRIPPNDPADESQAAVSLRARGARSPHTDAKVAAVRRLIEQTTLSYSEIALKAGVGRASICRWTRDGGWQRPVFAPRATDMVRTSRAGQKLKLRLLAERLLALADRAVRELEASPHVDVETLMRALQVLKMARLEAAGRKRRRRADLPCTGASMLARHEAVRTALKELRRGGVDIDHAPQEALDLVIEANTPTEEEHPALRPRR